MNVPYSFGVGEVVGSIYGPNVKSCRYVLLLCQICVINSISRENAFGPKQAELIIMHS